jgi:hypothetical protein
MSQPSPATAGRARLHLLPPLVALLALGFSGQQAEAQTPGREPAILEIPAGARALGLGMALQLGSNDPDVAFTHPALVQRLSGMQAGHTRFGSAATSYSLSAATDWFGGGVALSVRTLEYSGPAQGAGTRSGGLDPLLHEDEEAPGVSESAATVTWGRSLFGVALGVSGRLSSQRFEGSRVTAGTLDMGAAHSLGPVQVALSARNLGREPTLNGEGLALPREFVLGLGGYGRSLGPLDVGGAAQVTRRDDGEVIVGGGLEVGYWPVRGRTFVGRVGFRRVPEGKASPVTFGGSFWGDALVLDYAFQSVDGADGIHRISLGWR